MSKYIHIREGFFRRKLGPLLFTEKKFKEFKSKLYKLNDTLSNKVLDDIFLSQKDIGLYNIQCAASISDSGGLDDRLSHTIAHLWDYSDIKSFDNNMKNVLNEVNERYLVYAYKQTLKVTSDPKLGLTFLIEGNINMTDSELSNEIEMLINRFADYDMKAIEMKGFRFRFGDNKHSDTRFGIEVLI